MHSKVNFISVLLITYTMFLCRLHSNRQRLATISCNLVSPIKMSLACYV